MDARLIESLLQPAAYPDHAEEVRLLQTHISWIFLAGEFAYKVKKPVNFGFLDFSTLDRRRFYCDEEVRLNRRLCPETYLGVVPLRAAGDGASFRGDGAVIDYAVKMKRLPAERMADRLLASGSLTVAEVRSIAATVAAFHRSAARSPEIDGYGSPEAVRRNCEENFQQIEQFVGETISGRDLGLLRRGVGRFLDDRERLFTARVANGFIRECDGDIHLENICLTERVCIFDCIEFSDRLRCSDTAADIAFLLMDLDFHGRRDLAMVCRDEYLAVSGDSDAVPLLGFYSLCRAIVRGKVESLCLRDPGIAEASKREAREKACRHFRLARGYLLREALLPCLMVICGLSGSGKSTIAAALSFELGLTVLSSDRLRKEAVAVPLQQRGTDGYGEGLYTPGRNEATYREILSRADALLAAGEGVIVDATCRRSGDRERLRRLAAARGAPLHFIRVTCPEDVVRQRLEERAREGASLSDATWEVYLRQKEEFEPFPEGEEESLVVDNSAPPDESVDRILAALGLLR
jgi:aminoglycoside phosphotransferase family enzyme/predicted kinase